MHNAHESISGIDPGERGFVRLHLPQGLPLVPGDRFIIRESGQGVTLGGGEILDVDPLVAAAKARPDRNIDRVIAERGRVDIDHLLRLTGERRMPDVGNWAVAPREIDATTERIHTAVDQAGPLGLDLASLDDFERAVLDTLRDLSVDGGHVRVAAAADPLAEHSFVDQLAAAPFDPPGPEGIDRAELRELVRRGDVVEEDGVFFAASAIDDAALVVAKLLKENPEGITVAQARDAWGTTRKFAIPLITRLDSTGVTRRRDDLRIAGPRLPAL